MDFNEIAVFIQVVQEGSFSKAARKLGMPNSTVSHKVSLLEKRLGVTLLQRTTRMLNITPAGSAYFKRCLSGMKEIETAEHEIASVNHEPNGLLRVTGPAELGSNLFPELVSEFIRKYPKVRIELLLTDRTVDLLSEGVDLAIRAGELEDSSLIARKIGSAYFVPVASPKYLKGKPEIQHPRDLRQHQTLHHAASGLDEWHLIGPKGALDIPLTARAIANDLRIIKTLALKGEGVALLPIHECAADIRSGKLVRLLSGWQTETSPIHFVYPAQKFVTPKLSAFIEMANDSIKKVFFHQEL